VTIPAGQRAVAVWNGSDFVLSGGYTAFTGDATGAGTSSVALTLSNTGVAAGTYTKLTVDAKGRATSGTTLSSGDLPTYTGTLISSQVTNALGYTPYNSSNPSGFISGITSGMVTTALGYTPYNSSNPSGYITSSGSISGNAATATTATTANALNTSNNYTIYQRLYFGVTTQSVYAESGTNVIGFLSTAGGWLFRSDNSGNFTATGNVNASGGTVTIGSSALAPSGSAPSYTARAWVNFDGTNTPTILASGNASSITDNGVGDYTINFTTALADANYSIVVTGCATTDGDTSTLRGAQLYGPTALTTTSARIKMMNGLNNQSYDSPIVCISVFR